MRRHEGRGWSRPNHGFHGSHGSRGRRGRGAPAASDGRIRFSKDWEPTRRRLPILGRTGGGTARSGGGGPRASVTEIKGLATDRGAWMDDSLAPLCSGRRARRPRRSHACHPFVPEEAPRRRQGDEPLATAMLESGHDWLQRGPTRGAFRAMSREAASHVPVPKDPEPSHAQASPDRWGDLSSDRTTPGSPRAAAAGRSRLRASPRGAPPPSGAGSPVPLSRSNPRRTTR